jgi:hypothetical protein
MRSGHDATGPASTATCRTLLTHGFQPEPNSCSALLGNFNAGTLVRGVLADICKFEPPLQRGEYWQCDGGGCTSRGTAGDDAGKLDEGKVRLKAIAGSCMQPTLSPSALLCLRTCDACAPIYDGDGCTAWEADIGQPSSAAHEERDQADATGGERHASDVRRQKSEW